MTIPFVILLALGVLAGAAAHHDVQADVVDPCNPAIASEGQWIHLNDDFRWRAHSMVHDPARDRLVAFGGAFFGNRSIGATSSNQTWVRPADLSGPWQLLATDGPLPPTRLFHVAIFDPVGQRMILHGGYHPGQPGNLSDVWQLDFTSEPPRWSEIHPVGLAPSPRSNHAAVYDPVQRRMLIFAGLAGPFLVATNDAWELPLEGTAAWRRLLIQGTTLSRREGVRGAYDSRRGRWILSGGMAGGTTVPAWHAYRDVLAVDLATMQATRLPDLPHGSTSLFEHSMTYDPRRDRVLVFGGAEEFSGDVFSLSLEDAKPSWRSLARLAPPPSTRVEHTDWFDTRRERLLVVGGGYSDLLGGTGVLSFGRTVRVTLGAAASAPLPDRSRRPLRVVLHGSDALSVMEFDPSTIRIGETTVLERGSSGPAFSLRDVDEDGHLDAVIDVDPRLVGGGPVQVRGSTRIGESVCGEIGLEAVRADEAAMENGGPAVPAPERSLRESTLEPVAGAASRSEVRLRVRIHQAGGHVLELWSVRGSLVASRRIPGPHQGEVRLRPRSRLAPGVYWARISGSASSSPLRLVLAR